MFPHTSIVKNCMDNDGAVQNVQHATPRCRVFLWVSGKAHSEEEIVAGHLSPVLVSVSQLAFREKKKKPRRQTQPSFVVFTPFHGVSISATVQAKPAM